MIFQRLFFHRTPDDVAVGAVRVVFLRLVAQHVRAGLDGVAGELLYGIAAYLYLRFANSYVFAHTSDFIFMRFLPIESLNCKLVCFSSLG